MFNNEEKLPLYLNDKNLKIILMMKKKESSAKKSMNKKEIF